MRLIHTTLLTTLLLCQQLLMADDPIILDFPTALQRVCQTSPEIQQAYLEIEILEGQYIQAGLRPNPELNFEFDGFPGTAQFSEVNSSEITLSITQLIELGGKRSARERAALMEVEIARRNAEIVKADVAHDLLQDFINAFAAQEKIQIAEQHKKIDESILLAVQAKVENGMIRPIEQHKAEISLASTTHDFEHTKRQFYNLRQHLASEWGATCPDFDFVDYPFYQLVPLPALCDLSAMLANNPDIIKKQIEIATAEEILALEKAQRIPDVLVTAGVTEIVKRNQQAGTIELSIPLPFFDRNQGNISSSRSQVCLAEAKYEACRVELEISLNSAYREWTCAYHEVCILHDTILQKTADSYAQINEGYEQGKYELLDVLEAHQALLKAQEAYLDALVEYHVQKVSIERLIGKSLIE